MAHLSDPASPLTSSFFAVFICGLGVAHARHPWAIVKWQLIFAISPGVCFMATYVQIWISAPFLRLLLLSWPWINGLVVEVLICWQVFGLFFPSKGGWIHRYGICFTSVVAIFIQLYGLYARSVKMLPFVGAPLFHGLMTSSSIFHFINCRRTRHRFVSIGCSYMGATVASVSLAVVSHQRNNQFTHNAPICYLAHDTLELTLLSILYFIRKWEPTALSPQEGEAHFPNTHNATGTSVGTGYSFNDTSSHLTTPPSRGTTLPTIATTLLCDDNGEEYGPSYTPPSTPINGFQNSQLVPKIVSGILNQMEELYFAGYLATKS
ncbi:hypothetical protein BU23DRAFT_570117 [Bimuria novae-zelandiae CBS 107.79]|uniref:Uncharacterized protein n=1 Tax=Bimuria novae-zelandiae CBS 107.79 TaxID=1447943 RepID=A0A6A5V104_9PLEO|nr:hypothetical protein BU23DRAFT_570117 [Bimuria novae-zelandiae CBS 107.79]